MSFVPGTAAITPSSHNAKTILLTVLGECVAPIGREVWQETLVSALGALDISTANARQAIARAASDGQLCRKRVGRRSLLTISEPAWTMLHEGRERTMSFGAPQRWDGKWLIVLLTVPEARRELRYQLRTELTWLGYGSLGNGVWISAHTKYQQATLKLLQSNDGLAGAYMFVSDAPITHSPRALARQAWDLDRLLERYTDFDHRFGRAEPTTAREAFAAWIELLTAWRHFPLFDPELPESLLPTNWPRARARDLFRSLDAKWSPAAMDYFRSLRGGE